MEKQKWSDLSPGRQRLIVAAGAVETVLTVAVLVDLAGRPAESVRGPKAAWALASLVQPFGPVAYFVAGRR